jgi:hypothetical protein
MNLGYLRYLSTLRADLLNSQFVTVDEWNSNINQSMFELFDILTSKDGENYVIASPYTISTTGAKNYALPDGSASFAIGGVTPPAVYKLLGVDCGVAVGNNAWVTLPRYNWIDRNKFIYPQLQANALGVFNLSYRQMGNQLYFIPNPTAGQFIQIWYVPIMTQLLQDTDMLSFSISGWDEYVIVDAAIKALIKEESFEKADRLEAKKAQLLQRIETTAANRDQGQPNTISDTRSNTGFYDGGGFGGTGHGMAGWLVALFPMSSAHNVGNHLLAHSISPSKFGLAYAALLVTAAYLFHLFASQNGRWISLTRVPHALANSIPALFDHIRMVFGLGSKKEMIRANAKRIVAFMAAMKLRINGAMAKLVCKSVRSSGLTNSFRLSRQVPADAAIPAAIGIADPKPARRSFSNFLPKCLLRWFGHGQSDSAAGNSSQGGW